MKETTKMSRAVSQLEHIFMEYVFCCELRVSFMADRLALPRLALEEEIDVPITGNVLSGNGFPVMSRFG